MEPERRKLQAIGGSLFISIPRAWTERTALQKGAEVSLAIDASNNLVVSAARPVAQEHQSATLDFHPLVYRDIIREYLDGTETVVVRSDAGFTAANRALLARAVSSLLNSEIVEESHKRIVIQNFTAEKVAVRQLIRRMFYLTHTMLKDLAEEKMTSDVVHGIEERDVNVGRLYFAIIRHLRGILRGVIRDPEVAPIDCSDLRLLIERIERAGDEVKAVAAEMARGKRCKKDTLALALQRYEEAFTAYEKHDTAAAAAFWRTEKQDKAELGTDLHLQKLYDTIKDISDLVI